MTQKRLVDVIIIHTDHWLDLDVIQGHIREAAADEDYPKRLLFALLLGKWSPIGIMHVVWYFFPIEKNGQMKYGIAYGIKFTVQTADLFTKKDRKVLEPYMKTGLYARWQCVKLLHNQRNILPEFYHAPIHKLMKSRNKDRITFVELLPTPTSTQQVDSEVAEDTITSTDHDANSGPIQSPPRVLSPVTITDAPPDPDDKPATPPPPSTTTKPSTRQNTPALSDFIPTDPDFTPIVDAVLEDYGRLYPGLDSPVQGVYLEPNGLPALRDYSPNGIQIANLDKLVPLTELATLTGPAPVVLADLCDRDTVLRVEGSTRRLVEAYGAIVVRCCPYVDGPYGLMSKLSAIPEEASTIGTQYSSHQSSVPKSVHYQRLSSLDPTANELRHKCVKPKSAMPEGVYFIKNHPYDSGDDQFTPVDVWKKQPLDASLSIGTDELLLPDDIISLYGQGCGQLNAAGLGENIDGNSIAQLIDHPLKHVLGHLPQTLALAGLAYLGKHVPSRTTGKRKRGNDGALPDVAQPFDSRLKELKKISGGLYGPTDHLGNRMSLVPLHRAHCGMQSASLMLGGAKKIWIVLHATSVGKLLDVVDDSLRSCFLHHRSFFVHPNYLRHHDIPFTIVEQSPGDMILFDGESAYQAWSLGENLTSNVNYINTESVDRILTAHFISNNKVVRPCVCGHDEKQKISRSPILDIDKAKFTNPIALVFAWIRELKPFLGHDLSTFVDAGEDQQPISNLAHDWQHLYGPGY